MDHARLSSFLDWGERLFILALYGFLAVRVGNAMTENVNPLSALVLVAEGLVVIFVLIRSPARQISLHPLDWMLALGATAAPLLVRPAAIDPLAPAAVFIPLLFGGILVQIAAKLTLRRSFGLVAAHRGLVRQGLYGAVRHPIYLGYAISHVGFLLMVPTLWNAAVYGAALILQLARIEAEERLLSRDPDYQDFRRQVRYRLLPGLY